jgi:hypothetical protein
MDTFLPIESRQRAAKDACESVFSFASTEPPLEHWQCLAVKQTDRLKYLKQARSNFLKCHCIELICFIS